MRVDFSKRSEQAEIMDDFQGELSELRLLFNDINRANSILGGNNITINAVAKLMRTHPKDNYTLVDMGCGDGYLLRKVVDYCRKKGINIKGIGIDLNTETLLLAKEASTTYPELDFRCQDILELQGADLRVDILISTLTMHHFTKEELALFLKKFCELTDLGIVINDLHRSAWAYYLFKLFSLIFIRTKTAKIDGLISIRRGFIKSELIQHSKQLPEMTHHIRWKWAFRYAWVMQRNLKYRNNE